MPETLEEINKVNEGQDLILIGFKSFGTWEYEFVPSQETTPYYTKYGWNGEPFHIVKRQFILDNNLFEEENVVFADIEWAKQVENTAKSYTYVPKPLYQFQTGLDTSLTTKTMKGEI